MILLFKDLRLQGELPVIFEGIYCLAQLLQLAKQLLVLLELVLQLLILLVLLALEGSDFVAEVLDPLLKLALLPGFTFRSLDLLSELLLHLVEHVLPLLYLALGALELPSQFGDRLFPPAGHILDPPLLILFQGPYVALQLLIPLLISLALLLQNQRLVLQFLRICQCLGELGLQYALLVFQLLDQALVRVQQSLHVCVFLQLLLQVVGRLLMIPHQILELALSLIQRLAQGPDVLLRCFQPHFEIPDLLLLS